jgi:hypothetical protein
VRARTADLYRVKNLAARVAHLGAAGLHKESLSNPYQTLILRVADDFRNEHARFR